MSGSTAARATAAAAAALGFRQLSSPGPALHLPAKNMDGKQSMDAAAATKLRHDILLKFAVNAEGRPSNMSKDRRKNIKVNRSYHLAD
jgi:hypothetical protein